MSFESEKHIKMEKTDNTDISETVLSQSLLLLVQEFTKITEYNKHDIKYISFLQSNPFFYKILNNYVNNKKHFKGNYGKKLLKAIEKISEALASKMSFDSLKDSRFMSKFMSRF